MGHNHAFDVATLAALARQWVDALASDDDTRAQRLATQVLDSLLGTFSGGDFTSAANPNLAPGIYVSHPQGHALIVDATREAAVLDMGGVVSVAGVHITDWDQLARLGAHLTALADRKRASRGAPSDGEPSR